MKGRYRYMAAALLALVFAGCDSDLVPRAEYEAALSRADSLEGCNDSLQIELSDLKMYVDFLTEENTRLIGELNGEGRE